MAKAPKKTAGKVEESEAISGEERLHLQGLYSGCSAPLKAASSGSFWDKIDFNVYVPMGIAFWVFIYCFMGMGLLAHSQGAFSALALVLTVPAIFGVYALFRPQPGLGAWPANRMAAMTLALMILDFWVWVFNRPFEGFATHVFLFIDIAAFALLMFCVYMFAFKRLHIDIVVRILMVKAFFDFAAYVLSGGFGIALLSRFGISHPLHLDALFTVAMLELWALLVYILKYRNKINTLPQ